MSELKLEGKIVKIMEKRGGISQRDGSQWTSQSFLLETREQYPRKVLFDVFGAERLDKFQMQEGMECTVYFDINAREHEGRWYNSIRAYDVRNNALTIPVKVHNADGSTEVQDMPFPADQSNLGY